MVLPPVINVSLLSFAFLAILKRNYIISQNEEIFTNRKKKKKKDLRKTEK